MTEQVQVLEKKYKDLRIRIVEELERVESRLDYYAKGERDNQVIEMERKYLERKEKLFAELDRVDERLASYAALKLTSSKASTSSLEDSAASAGEPKAQKMYRGRPVG